MHHVFHNPKYLSKNACIFSMNFSVSSGFRVLLCQNTIYLLLITIFFCTTKYTR